MSKEKIDLKKLTTNSIIITMLCHSFCCVLPMVGLLFGVNIIGSMFHTYEWLFITLNLLGIVFGFYFTYLHKEKQCDHKHCNPISKKIYWITTIVSIFLILI